MRFSIRNLRAEKVCHSLYFPQSLDLTKLLETEGEPCSAEEQVRALVLLTHTCTHTPPPQPLPHTHPGLIRALFPSSRPSDTASFVCLLPVSCPASHTPEVPFGFGGVILSSVAELRTHREELSPTLSVICGNILTHSRNTDLSNKEFGVFLNNSHGAVSFTFPPALLLAAAFLFRLRRLYF